MSARSKGRNGRSSSRKKKGKGRANGTENGTSSTVDEMFRMSAVYKKYLESSDDESELEEDAWEEGVYEIDKIVDEFVDMAGNHKYQVDALLITLRLTDDLVSGQVLWKNWKRKSDGTSTTWVRQSDLGNEAAEALADWQIEKKRRIIERRKKYAVTGYPIELFANLCFTRFNTVLEELGLGADQELTLDMIFPSHIDDVDLEWDQEVAEAKALALAHMPRKSSSSHFGSPLLPVSTASVDDMDFGSTPRGPAVQRRHRASSSTTHYATPMASTPQKGPFNPDEGVQMLPRPRKRGLSPEPVSSSSARSVKRAKRGKGRRIQTDRTILQDKWDRATLDDKAARVVLVNEVDDERIPPSVNLATFEYMERGPYKHDGTLSSHTGFLEGCTCEDGCTDPGRCLCQGDDHAEKIWKGAKRVFAYDKNGIYRFPSISVTECNDSCQCNLTCPNRVAQRPRDVPMEVFKTQNRGWGVRATVSIKRGKVLGTFTGDLRPAEDATGPKSQDEDWSYELDWFTGAHQWRVTSKDCGNWSRFLNHSCFPNLKVYAVLYDSVLSAGDNRHRLGFVATQDIEPLTELTVNYSPQDNPGSGERCCIYGGCAR